MKVSVVMTTYNGEKYIYDQLKSLNNQTQPPNEVKIFDDCSSDNTVSLIKKFIEEKSLNWSLTVNEENKGWQRNFIEAMRKATGDIIFLCDQDDIWMKDKIEYMVNGMKSNEKIKCLAGNMITINSTGENFNNKQGYSTGSNTNKIQEIPFTKKFNTITLLGCSLCMTKEISELISKLDVINFSHDAQTCRLANLLEGMYSIDRIVLKYRIHNNNTSGVNTGVGFGSASLEKRINTIKANIHWLEILLNYYASNGGLSDYKLRVILQTMKMQKKRFDFLTSKNMLKFVGLFKYKSYYSNISMLIGDFSYCYGFNKLSGKILWYLKMPLKALKQ